MAKLKSGRSWGGKVEMKEGDEEDKEGVRGGRWEEREGLEEEDGEEGGEESEDKGRRRRRKVGSQIQKTRRGQRRKVERQGGRWRGRGGRQPTFHYTPHPDQKLPET
ncbi:hypothetical protein Pmani_027509 [Petrolisthes manimaculis]|uniref:Uncharacterized protein n=1 Tax=Petrolisthes manimaculis TaxID=1843537 RepID=A0AAE1P444_9EUCA|nr:hypothetical protein Pmani_027509 [Petrolisthes manimaculis]